MRKDRILSISLLVFCLIMFMETFNFAEKSKMNIAGPEVYPRIVIASIAAFSVILLIRSFFSKADPAPRLEWKEFIKKYMNIILLFLFFGIYVFLLPNVGFIIATILFMFVSQALLMGVKKRKQLIVNICVTSVSTFFIYFIFTNFLSIWLP
jgi:putative tricarboxylic transport membrane protein